MLIIKRDNALAKERDISEIESYGIAVLHKRDPRAVFVIFSVYLDESGTNTDQDRLVIAGMVGREYQWTNWEHEIKKFQRRTGIKRLHYVDLYEQIKPLFPNLDRDQLRRKKLELIKALALVAGSELDFCLYTTLARSNYQEKYLKKGFPAGITPASEYALCLWFAVESAVNTLFREYGDKVSKILFLLEGGGGNAQEIVDTYTEYRNNVLDRDMRDRVASTIGLIDNSKKDNRPLFAADLVAHDSLFLENQLKGKVSGTKPGSKKSTSIRTKIYRTNLTRTRLAQLRRMKIQSASR